MADPADPAPGHPSWPVVFYARHKGEWIGMFRDMEDALIIGSLKDAAVYAGRNAPGAPVRLVWEEGRFYIDPASLIGLLDED